MICAYVGMYLSTVIFFVTGFVRTVPVSLEEAARIDGAGPLRVFLTIILPLLRPVLATATILISLYVWNDVFYAFFVVGVLFTVFQRQIISGITSGAVK